MKCFSLLLLNSFFNILNKINFLCFIPFIPFIPFALLFVFVLHISLHVCVYFRSYCLFAGFNICYYFYCNIRLGQVNLYGNMLLANMQ